MAYTAVPTVSTGDTWTAANHNQYIRDNFAATYPQSFTATGQLVIGTGVATGQLLNVSGTTGYALRVNPSVTNKLEWSGPAPARYYTSTGQDIETATVTVVNFDTQDFDPRSLVTTGAAWVYTCDSTGYFQVASGVKFKAAAAGLQLRVYVGAVLKSVLSNNVTYANGGTIVSANNGDAIDVRVYHTAASTGRLRSTGVENWVSITKLP